MPLCVAGLLCRVAPALANGVIARSLSSSLPRILRASLHHSRDAQQQHTINREGEKIDSQTEAQELEDICETSQQLAHHGIKDSISYNEQDATNKTKETLPMVVGKPDEISASSSRRHESGGSPSLALEAAFESRGLGHLVDKQMVPTHKVDHTNVSPKRLITRPDSRHSQWRRAKAKRNLVEMLKRSTSLTTICARYIISHNAAPGSESSPITIEQEAYLKSRSFTIEDVKLWAFILTERMPTRAAAVLYKGRIPGNPAIWHKADTIPQFVYLNLLRRPHLPPDALRNIINRIWANMLKVEFAWGSTHNHGQPPAEQDDSSTFIAIIRLFRHARVVWPEALVSISHLFIQASKASIKGKEPGSKRHAETQERLCNWYNKVLRMVAMPIPGQPFASAPYQQRAQFDLVAAMASFEPPLTILRQGYQAITKVQLTHKKTARENDWSQLKARSWPPWKEDKTGLDTEKGFKYGTSRALETIVRAAEAGYAQGPWEEIAKILAGWDSDYSPTIQTRASLLLPGYRKPPSIEQATRVLYASRIAATRTRQEAWACFLAYKDQHPQNSGDGPTSDARAKTDAEHVYSAMLVKLQMKEIDPLVLNDDGLGGESRSLEPGDHREVYPTPVSPMESTYTRIEPPTSDAFAHEMYKNGIQISGQGLEFLLLHAQSLDRGLEYVYWAYKHDPSLGCLFSTTPESISRAERLGDLQTVPANIYRAFLKLLCNFPSTSTSIIIPSTNIEWRPRHTAFFVAVRLAKARNDRQTMTFIPIESALRDRKLVFEDLGERKDSRSSRSLLKRYIFFQRAMAASLLVGETKAHMGAYGHLCLRLLSGAVDVAVQAKDKQMRGIPLARISGEDPLHVESVLTDTSANLQKLFYKAATGTSKPMNHGECKKESHPSIPKLLAVPPAAYLHIITRIFGVLRDYQAILNLFSWIQDYEDEIFMESQERRNGPSQLHRALVASRVFFERSWLPEHRRESTAASQAQCDRLRELALATKVFGHWPDEDDVTKYCSSGYFPPL